MKVDVVIPAKFRERINPQLLQVLENSHFVNNLIITTERPLSLARKHACLKAETEWVAMFDDDMIIPPNWFKEVFKHIDKITGAISTVEEDANIHLRAYQKVVNIVFPLRKVDTAPHVNNVLIRKELLKNYNPPPLFLSEDFFLRRHVEGQGYKWKVIGSIGVVHTGEPKNNAQIAIAYKRYKHYNFYQLVRRFVAHLLLAPFAVLLTQRFATLIELWRDNVEFLAGWLKG